MIKQVKGTVTVPNNEPSTGGVYNDLELKLYYVDGLTETLDQTISVSTSNEYLFNYEDTGLQVKVKLVRASTGQLLGNTYIRGVLPRSFEVPETQAAYFTDFIHHCYTHDAGLAVAAVTANKWWSLVKEINHGLSLAVVSGGTIPHQVNHVVPTGNAYYKTQSVAMIAYSLGYYLENQPMASDKQEVADTLYSLLKWLSQKRSPLHGGLLIDGTGQYIDSNIFDSNYVDQFASTISNIAAYFAFKQAGLVLNDIFTGVAETLKEAINTKLYNSAIYKFYLGMYPTGVNVGDNLETNLMGIYFLVDDEDLEAAEFLLNHIEANYKFVDVTLNVTGYKALTDSTKIWFEGSYMAAMAYHRIGNTSKYRTIIKELNKLQDPSDGSFKNGIIKYGRWEIVPYKSTGSTAWSYMVNTVPNEIFNFNREINQVPGLTPIYYNAELSGYFVTDCPEGEVSDSHHFRLLALSFSSTISQEDVDEIAENYFMTQGQLLADLNGVCSPTGSTLHGNEARQMWFKQSNCPSLLITPPLRSVTIPANTYYSDESVFDANATADLWMIANGQAQANQGFCLSPIYHVTISPEVTQIDDSAYINFRATSRLDTAVSIAWEYSTDGGTTWTPSTGTTMTFGANRTFSQYVATLPSGGFEAFSARITSLTPDSGIRQRYIYEGEVLEIFENVERECIFFKNDCPSNSGTAVVYTVPSGIYTSIISQDDADAQADKDIQLNGQAYANTQGGCTGVNIYYNSLQVSGFTKNDCVVGAGTTVIYTIPDSTYQSTVSVEDANNLALADIATNGQTYANTNGVCVGTNQIVISIEPRYEDLGFKTFVYVKAVANQAVTTNIGVSFNYTYNGVGYTGSEIAIPAGLTESDEVFVRAVKPIDGEPLQFDFVIHNINPANHGGYNYVSA